MDLGRVLRGAGDKADRKPVTEVLPCRRLVNREGDGNGLFLRLSLVLRMLARQGFETYHEDASSCLLIVMCAAHFIPDPQRAYA